VIAIFDTAGAAQAYCDEIDAALGYPCAGVPADEYPRGWTLTWATPNKHATDDLWSVKVCADARAPAVPANTGVVAKLPDGWYPAPLEAP
jgi:hypothetical protein